MTIKVTKTGEKFGYELYELLICTKGNTQKYDGVSNVATKLDNKNFSIENVNSLPLHILLMCTWGKGFYENPIEKEISVLSYDKAMMELGGLSE